MSKRFPPPKGTYFDNCSKAKFPQWNFVVPVASGAFNLTQCTYIRHKRRGPVASTRPYFSWSQCRLQGAITPQRIGLEKMCSAWCFSERRLLKLEPLEDRTPNEEIFSERSRSLGAGKKLGLTSVFPGFPTLVRSCPRTDTRSTRGR